MREKEISELAKKTLRLFKKFAKENKFFLRYIKLSNPLKRGKTFIQVIDECEPISLIQSSSYFCAWPCVPFDTRFAPYATSKKTWRQLSYEWGQICADNELWHDKYEAERYASTFICGEHGEKVDFDKKNK